MRTETIAQLRKISVPRQFKKDEYICTYRKDNYEFGQSIDESFTYNKKCEKLLYNIHNLKYKVGTDEVDVPSFAQIKNDNSLKFLEHPFDAASYLVEYYYPIRSEVNA